MLLLLDCFIGDFYVGCLSMMLLVGGWYFTFRTLETIIFILILAILMGICWQQFPLMGALLPGFIFSLTFLPLLVFHLVPGHNDNSQENDKQ